jgi:hypothetical protein
MVSQVLDYSGGFPGAAAIKDAGYPGAVRYIGTPGNRKNATALELADFIAHGIGMALVFEQSATNWRGGFERGKVDGRAGRDHANRIGFSADRPIYMVIDQDVVLSGEFAAMIEYLRGAGTTLGGAELVGVYGEADVIDRARDAGVAHWFWQTAAWSRGRVAGGLHLYQRVGTVTVNGVPCDVNDIKASDWGQHQGGDMPLTDEDKKAVAAEVMSALYGARFEGNRNIFDLGVENLRQTFAIKGGVDALSDDETKVLAAMATTRGDVLTAVADIPHDGAPSDDQMVQLAERLKAGLGEELAQVLGHKLVS